MNNNMFSELSFWMFSIILFFLFSMMFIAAFFLPVNSVSNQMNPISYAKVYLETGNNLELFMNVIIPVSVLLIIGFTIYQNIKKNKKGTEQK